MTIASQSRTAGPFTGTGLLVSYPFAFKVFTTADLLIQQTDTSGNLTTWGLGANYTVVLNADQNTAPGGTITPMVALPAGYVLNVTSAISATQGASLTNAGGFFPKTIEDALDRVTVLLQQQTTTASGALRVPEITGTGLLPAIALRANQLLSFDSLGNPIAVAAVGGSATALALTLAGSGNTTQGAGTIGFGPSLAYGTGTVGARINRAGHPSFTNTIVGFGAFNDSTLTGTIGYRCTVFGANAMAVNASSVTAGGSNCAFGYSALAANIDGSGNNAFGAFALSAVTGVAASHNNAFGYQSQQANVSGVQNNSFGFRTLYSLTTGNNNHAFGESALNTLPSGNGNHAFGFQALYSKTAGDNSHAFGYQALFGETTGTFNSAFGYTAGYNMGAAIGNTIMGYGAVGTGAPQPGNNNSVFGYQALNAVNATVGTNGQFNCTFGYWSLLRLTTGSSNTAIGQQAGSFVTTGDENIFVGSSAGVGITTGTHNICVGVGSTSAANRNNTIALGFNAQPTGDNQVVLGDTNIGAIRAQVTTITALSDMRDKASPTAFAFGLELINAVEINSWTWAIRGGSQRNGQRDFGVLSQQLLEVQTRFGAEWLGLVDASNEDRLEATPGKLLFPAIVAIQQLSAKCDDLQQQLDAFKRAA